MSYKIQLEKFEGPLDLLLYLIKKNDIDICDIPIAQITDQYMEYIGMMKMLDLDIIGDFLVMAATLMQIKSRMLLPPDPLAAEEHFDPRDELVQRLQEYQQFKRVAEELKAKETSRQNLFTRIIDEEQLDQIKEESREVFFEATLFDLINALNAALKNVPAQKTYDIKAEEYTVEGKIHAIFHLLLERGRLTLLELFGKASGRSEMVVTFVAILELIRQKEIVAIQRRQFEDIEIMRNIVHEVPVE
ncbi:MAG: segregation/condensation protein A [Candidatus Omnitrophica bacterium]|nr:segregation/condensation protein A [Candidatus Omnitrophota bacterium]